MPFTPLSIDGAWVHEPEILADRRGDFREKFKLSDIESALGRTFTVKQSNLSRSHAGVLRGIHWADTPPGQAKYVSCEAGRVIDFVVDIRTNSNTFGQWEAIELTPENGKSVLISEGLGHGFLSLDDNSLVSYLCSEEYNAASEHSINPLGEGLKIPFSDYFSGTLILSERDQSAASFKDQFSL
jgi:dTDP-4-dehydrorhamnose 3,5-epimerase